MRVLKSIDVLIGLTVVLLALSMAVTVVTQTLTTIVNSRGRHLRRGLVDLLQQLDPQITETVSKTVATKILTHPLVSGSNTPIEAVQRLVGGPRLGNVVHREEFTKLLMGLACDGGTDQLGDSVKQSLKSALQKNGIDDPEQALKNIRQLALQLERSQPELSSVARQNLAILHAAESDLVAKINNWFDQTMDRTSQRFTASTRGITFVGAFLVAFALQVDTPAIVNRLSADETLRQQFVDEAKTLYGQPALSPASEQQLSDEQKLAGAQQLSRKYTTLFSTTGLISLPTSEGWTEGFTSNSMLGMLLTALLLSLGAPFWYNVLGQLLRLRSVLPVKDDAQRTERQTSETNQASPGVAGSKPTPAVPPVLAGERGDLAAIG